MIKNLTTLRADDSPLFGGKAASLGEVSSIGIPIPRGIAISIQAYRHHVFVVGGDKLLRQFWDDPDTDRSEDLSDALSKRLIKFPPLALSVAVLRNFNVSCIRELMVRSSATVEDSRAASFAGLFFSRPSKPLRRELALAVCEVWLSASSPHVKSYTKKILNNGFTTIDMAVVVQERIKCSTSGLFFTKHPTVSIPGLGLLEFADAEPEALVGGNVRPTMWRVNLSDHRFAIERDGEFPHSLSPSHFAQLIGYGAQLRQHFGCHVDIEWGIGTHGIVIFQCRPVTA